MTGESASELGHNGQVATPLIGTLDYCIDTIFNYPRLAECCEAAAFDCTNQFARCDS